MTPAKVYNCILILSFVFSCRPLSAQDPLSADVSRVLGSPRTSSALYASISDFLQRRTDRAQNTLIAAMEGSQDGSFMDASSKFLLALEILSRPDLSARNLEIACRYLTSIDERAFVRQPELRTELFFWRGECARLYSAFGEALEHYEKALHTGYRGGVRQFALLRIGEIADRLSNVETALTAYESLLAVPHDPLVLEASLRRASLFYRIGKHDSALVELGRSQQHLAAQQAASSSVREVIPSPFQEILVGNQDPSTWYFPFEIPSRAPSEKLLVAASTQARIALIRGSVLTELELYDAAIAAFDDGLRAIAAKPDSVFASGEKEYYRDGLEFEKAWAYFKKGEYAQSADRFYALASGDTARRMQKTPQAVQRRFKDPFYEEPAARQTGAIDSGSRTELGDQLRQFYFNDFPSRARYYAGVAYARAGQSQKALRLLTELSQNRNIIYSEHSNFYQALIEFQNGRMYQVEALLEPIGFRRTTTGAYASLLLGDIYYRRSSFAKAAEYLGFALEYLPAADSALRARAELELGLSLIPLGSWARASNSLQHYLEHANEHTIANDEALFWLGRAYYRADSIALARAIFERLLREYPNSERLIDAQYTYAWTLLREGQFQRAASAFAEVVRRDSITRYAYDALSRQGDASYALGDLKQALAIYNKAVDRPTFSVYLESRAMFQLGVARLKSDSSRSAMNAFNYIVNKLPTSDIIDRAHYDLALAAYAIQLDDRARESINVLEKDFPASPYASRGALLVAEEYERSGQDAAAIAAYRRLLSSYPASEESETALFNLIDLLARNKRYPEAIGLIDTALSKASTAPAGGSARLSVRKAELQLESADPRSSLRTLSAFVRTYPADALIPHAQYTIGKALLALGSIDSAIAQFRMVADSFPETDAAAYSYLQLARAEAKRSNPESAAVYYRKAFDQRYYSSDAAPLAMSEYAGFLRTTLAMPDSALKIYDALTERYLIETSAGTNAQFESVEILLAKDRQSEAVARLEKIALARKGERSGGEARLKIAVLYRRQGATKRALAEYDRARNDHALTNDQLGRSLIGSAEMQIALGNKRSAKSIVQELLTKRGISRPHRLRAEQLMQEIAPKKKPVRTPRRGKR